MIEIGAGGGSIATVDTLGRIQMGPDSAGADPGPACYDRGGNRATVTDADTVLGRLAPEYFAEGRLVLNESKGRQAVATSLQKIDSSDVTMQPLLQCRWWMKIWLMLLAFMLWSMQRTCGSTRW